MENALVGTKYASRIWAFVDWAEGCSDRYGCCKYDCGAVLNATWHAVCAAVGFDSGLDMANFCDNYLDHKGAFTVNGKESVHATAAAIVAGLDVPETAAAFEALLRRVCPETNSFSTHPGGPSASYAPHIAEALDIVHEGKDEAKRYILNYYGGMARQHGTLWEQKDDKGCMAHAGSVSALLYL
jgi:hypothetical protein